MDETFARELSLVKAKVVRLSPLQHDESQAGRMHTQLEIAVEPAVSIVNHWRPIIHLRARLVVHSSISVRKASVFSSAVTSTHPHPPALLINGKPTSEFWIPMGTMISAIHRLLSNPEYVKPVQTQPSSLEDDLLFTFQFSGTGYTIADVSDWTIYNEEGEDLSLSEIAAHLQFRDWLRQQRLQVVADFARSGKDAGMTWTEILSALQEKAAPHRLRPTSKGDSSRTWLGRIYDIILQTLDADGINKPLAAKIKDLVHCNK